MNSNKKHNFIYWLVGMIIVVSLVPIVKNWYLKPGIALGEQAHEFSGILPDGSNFTLSDLKGKYVLLDFWGSWCGPCAREAPAIIALHETYGNARFKDAEGFVIVNVAIEKDSSRWQPAIEKHGLNWRYHLLDTVSNFRILDSPIAKMYGVKQVPTKFLLNAKGVIVSVDPTAEEVGRYLKGRL